MLIDVTGKMVIDQKVRDWCRFPYPDHPNGCPNWNKSDTCPPKVKLVTDIFDLSQKHWFAIVEFDIAAHVNKMSALHPDWSERQCKCVLYWQGTVKKKLKEYCLQHIKSHAQMIYTICPEAMGVNVFRTAQRCGIKIRKNPDKIIYKVALIGISKHDNDDNLFKFANE